jgi:uncharacterized membrane protein YczE
MHSNVTGTEGPIVQKLPVLATVARTYRAVFGELTSIYKASWLALVVLIPLTGYVAFFESRGEASGIASVKFIWSLFSNLSVISLAVAWQRYMTIGASLPLVGSNLRDRSLWNYVGVGLKIGLLTIFPAGLVMMAVAFTLSKTLGVAPIDMPAPYLVASIAFNTLVGVLGIASAFRLSPLLAARAADDLQSSFQSLWNRTRANTWRLAMVTLLCMLPPYVLSLLAFGPLSNFGLQIATDDPTQVSEWSHHMFAAVAMVATLLYPIAVCLAFGAIANTYNHFVMAEEYVGPTQEMSAETQMRLEHRW